MTGEGQRGRVVERGRGRQVETGDPAEPVAQLDRGERVEAEFGEGPGGWDGFQGAVPQDGGDGAAYQVEGRPILFRFGQGAPRVA